MPALGRTTVSFGRSHPHAKLDLLTVEFMAYLKRHFVVVT
jgi:hypothetical protein